MRRTQRKAVHLPLQDLDSALKLEWAAQLTIRLVERPGLTGALALG